MIPEHETVRMCHATAFLFSRLAILVSDDYAILGVACLDMGKPSEAKSLAAQEVHRKRRTT